MYTVYCVYDYEFYPIENFRTPEEAQEFVAAVERLPGRTVILHICKTDMLRFPLPR